LRRGPRPLPRAAPRAARAARAAPRSVRLPGSLTWGISSSLNTYRPATGPRFPGIRSHKQSQAVSKQVSKRGYGLRGVGTVKLWRRFIQEPRAVDAVVVVLSTWFVLGGYVIAYAYVHDRDHVLEPARSAGFTAVTAAWSLLTLYLF